MIRGRIPAILAVLSLSLYARADISSVATFPEGSAGEVQFEDGGVFGADSTFSFNKTTNVLTVYRVDGTSAVVSGNLKLSYLNCSAYTNGGTLTTDASGNVTCANDDSTSGTGAPGGSNTQVQYNNAGAHSGDSGFTYSSTTQHVVIGSSLTIDGIKLSRDHVAFRLTISSNAIVEGTLVVGGTNGGSSAGNTTFINSAGTTVHHLSTISNPVSFNQDTAGRDFKVGTNGGLDTLFVSASSNTVDVRGAGGLRTTYGITAATGAFLSGLTVAGSAVCRADGTNCPASSGGSTPYVRSGYSSRFSESFSVNSSTEALDAIFDFVYQAPGVTLASSPSATYEELGSTLTNVALTAFTVKTSSNITSVVFKRNGTAIKNIVSPTSGGGSELYTDTNSVTATAAYTAVVGDGTGSTTSNTITFTFVYPFYYGVGAQSLTGAQVQALTKLVQGQSNTTTVTSPTSQVYYFAYPQSYGVLSSITDQNGFSTLAGYTRRSVSLTMLDSTTQSYYIYEFNTPTTQTSFSNTYTF